MGEEQGHPQHLANVLVAEQGMEEEEEEGEPDEVRGIHSAWQYNYRDSYAMQM